MSGRGLVAQELIEAEILGRQMGDRDPIPTSSEVSYSVMAKLMRLR